MTKTFGISETDAEAIPKLGFLIWHECSVTNRTYDEVNALVVNAGFGETFPKANRKKAYHHALKTYGRSSNRVTVDKITPTATMFFHQVTAVTETKNRRHEDILDFRAEVKTRFNKDTQDFDVLPISRGSKAPDLEAELKNHIDNYLNIVHADVVRVWISNELRRMNAVVARRSGGLWFISADYAETIEKLEEVLQEIGCTMFSHPVFDTTTWRTNTAGFVEEDLLGEFKNLKNDLDALVTESRGTGEVRKYKLETMLSRFKKLEDKEGMYEDLLQVTIEDLQSGVSAVKKQITSMMLGKVTGVTPVDKAGEIRERARAETRRAKTATKAAHKAVSTKKANAAKLAKAKLASKLATVKKPVPTKASAVKQAKKVDTPF